MDKIAKYYLSVEGVALLGIFLSGEYDPSFLVFGTIYVGFALSVIGALISSVWCIKRLETGGKIMAPFMFVIGNMTLFVCMLSFITFLFSGGIRFTMMP